MSFTRQQALALRKDIDILSSYTYLDNAATNQPLAQVRRAMHAFTDEHASVRRGVYRLSSQATAAYEKARSDVAHLINAHQIVFTKGATESINCIARGCDSLLGQRNTIVISSFEHHANLIPWQQLAKRRNMRLRVIPLTDHYELDYDALHEMLDDSVALVACTHVSNALGSAVDVARVCSLARQCGALSVIDAAQSIGHMRVDVEQIGCDFLVASGHKMLGPCGIGFLYGRLGVLEQIEPLLSGGEMISHVDWEQSTWADLPYRLEAGTPNAAGAVGMGEAARFLSSLDIDKVNEYLHDLIEYAREGLSGCDRITLLDPPHTSSILSFVVDGAHPHDIASLLDDHKVCIRAGHHCAMPLMSVLGVEGTCRISVQLYNTREDIDVFIGAIRSVLEVLK